LNVIESARAGRDPLAGSPLSRAASGYALASILFSFDNASVQPECKKSFDTEGSTFLDRLWPHTVAERGFLSAMARPNRRQRITSWH
jgi:hypothetical protein